MAVGGRGEPGGGGQLPPPGSKLLVEVLRPKLVALGRVLPHVTNVVVARATFLAAQVADHADRFVPYQPSDGLLRSCVRSSRMKMIGTATDANVAGIEVFHDNVWCDAVVRYFLHGVPFFSSSRRTVRLT
jgi:hypothetical protein